MSVASLIDSAVARAGFFSDAAASAVANIGASRGVEGYSYISVSPSQLTASFSLPNPDTTPMPIYEAPAIAMPTSPNLMDIPVINIPVAPTAPTLNTSGLFNQTAPSSTMPDFTAVNPVLHIDSIYNDLANLAAPVLQDVQMPTITALNIGAAPTLTLPTYSDPTVPDQLQAPINYATYMHNAYEAAVPEMQAYIDGIVTNWVNNFAPEYYSQRDSINAKIVAAMNNTVLPDQIENAMFSRAQARAENEFHAAENQILEGAQRRGFLVPPSAVTSNLNKARIEAAKGLAGQSTEVYIERRKSEVQHLQFILNIASQQINTVRTLAVQYAQTGVQVIEKAYQLADSLTQKIITVFEHEKSRREFSLALMNALNGVYETKLKAALSGLEGFKLTLQALELQSNVEFKKVEAAKLQVESQQLLVARYSAMIDAIAKRATVDELALKNYQIQAEIFKVLTDGRVASFKAYEAAIDGDRGKLDGQLALVNIYDAQLKAMQTNIEAQTAIVEADVKSNQGKLSQYSTQAEVYKTASEIALNKFTANAEIKKLGLDVYKTNIEANVEVFKSQMERQLALLNADIEAFKGNISSLSNFYALEKSYTELDLRKTEAIAQGYTNMASATLQSLNSTISMST